MISVEFYKFSKKENSLKVPESTSGALILNCLIKENCSLINPVLRINTASQDITDIAETIRLFNYAHIEAFGGRYYFVEDWSWNLGFWTATLKEDVLGSWRSEILASEEYVIRSYSAFDGNIVDGMYPTKGGASITVTEAESPFTGGAYILGMYGADESGNAFIKGPISYYALSEAQMQSFTKSIFGEGLRQEVVSELLNPIDYVASCYYCPIPVALGNNVQIKAGWYLLFDDEAQPINGHAISNWDSTQAETTITIPVHPQAASRGSYLYLSPYSRYKLDLGPFGSIPLDPSDLYNTNTIKLSYAMDFATGDCVLIISAGNKKINSLITNIGVQAPLAQKTTTNATGFLSGIGSGIASIVSGNIFGGLTGMVDAAKSLLPQMTRSNSQGSIAALYPPYLISEFVSIVDEDWIHTGRPLCQKKELSTLTGFTQLKDGDIAIPATTAKLQSIKNYLETGFFIE